MISSSHHRIRSLLRSVSQFGHVLLLLVGSTEPASAQSAPTPAEETAPLAAPAPVPGGTRAQTPPSTGGAENATDPPPPTRPAAQVPVPESPAATEQPPPTDALPETVATPPKVLERVAEAVTLGGGAILWYYQPTRSGQKNKVELYHLRVTIDAEFGGGLGIHAEPRLRESKLRSFFGGTTWLEEGYAWYRYREHAIKVGKIYSKLGLFWDNSFWGNVQVYDGLKLAPDFGASLEGNSKITERFGIGYTAQFFVIDGGTNVSLPGRDTLSGPDGRRRNEVVLRIDPSYQFAQNGSVRVGLSGQRLEADAPGIPGDDRDVLRYGLDAHLSVAGFGVWGEYLRQNGQSVTDYPIAGVPETEDAPAVPGRASKHIHYVLAGAEYTLWRVTARYNFSAADYTDADVKEWMHVPALGFRLNEHLQLNAEYVHWSRSLSGAHEPYDRSFNLELFADL